MTLGIRFTDDAEADIDEIGAFSLDRFGRTRGRAYIRGLRAACARLRDFPGMAPYHPDIDPPTRVLVHRSHRIFYRLEPDRILILRILHHARSTPGAL